MQVLGAELVKRPVIAALDHTPERVSPLCRGLALDILANGVLHGLVPRQPAIARVIGGIDGVVLDKAVQRLVVRPLDWLGHHAVGGTVLGANHNRLASGRAGTTETPVGDERE